MKHPAVYVYKRTSDKGQELRYSIRSLQNIRNWNGEVFIVGDTEDWFSKHITVLEATKVADKYQDRNYKLLAAIGYKRIAQDFIYMNDDFYCVIPSEVTPLYGGQLEDYTGTNEWATSKSNTKAYLESRGWTVRDYELHTPMLFNKQKLSDTLLNHPDGLQIRSLYGNIYQIGGKKYEDCKYPDNKLAKRKFISTRQFNPELEELFPSKSRFEK